MFGELAPFTGPLHGMKRKNPAYVTVGRAWTYTCIGTAGFEPATP